MSASSLACRAGAPAVLSVQSLVSVLPAVR